MSRATLAAATLLLAAWPAVRAADAADPPAAPSAASGPDASPMPSIDGVPVTPAEATGLLPAPRPVRARDGELLQVADAYLELHTGAGRGYPVFFTVARGEWIDILLRHTDWYKVRTAQGKEGWVHRSQLATTLTEHGGARTFRDIVLDDYLARRFEVGAGYGRFHHEPMVRFWATWRFSDTLSIEGTYGQVQGAFSGTDLWHLNLQVEPWSDQRFSPYFGVGFGHFRNVPNLSLVQDATTNARLGVATAGARWHVGDRFVVRLDYSLYTALLSDQKSTQYHAASLGLGVFF